MISKSSNSSKTIYFGTRKKKIGCFGAKREQVQDGAGVNESIVCWIR